MRHHFWIGDPEGHRWDTEPIPGVAVTKGRAICNHCGARGYVIGSGAVLDDNDEWILDGCDVFIAAEVMSM